VPVTVTYTHERQEAFTAARGKKFFVTGGEHVTLDDMFKAVEINRQIKEATEREKEKKSQVEYHARCQVALPILDLLKNDLESNVARLTRRWRFSLNGKALQCRKWETWQTDLYCTNNLLREQRRMQASQPDGQQEDLDALRNAPIKLSNTAYRQCVCVNLSSG
jgi:hypothetical protein